MLFFIFYGIIAYVAWGLLPLFGKIPWVALIFYTVSKINMKRPQPVVMKTKA